MIPYTKSYNFVVMFFLLRLIAPCPDPGLPYQGNRIGDDFRHDKTVMFTCPRDYRMEGLRTIKCLNGQWNNRKPSCKGKLYTLSQSVKGFFSFLKPKPLKLYPWKNVFFFHGVESKFSFLCNGNKSTQ